jgi:hypothetical protein
MTACLLAAAGCSRSTPTEPWPPIIDPIVFTDTFGSKVGFQAFRGSKLDALSIDAAEKQAGTASLKFTVPAPGNASGGYAGGAFVTRQARSLAPYNALSFWVKASRPVPLEVAGLGNDNTGTSKYEAKRTAIPITAIWSHVLVPIPLSSKLEAEGGLFFVAEGPQSGAGLTIWIDEVRFVNDPTITNPRPALAAQTLNTLVGSTIDLQGATKTTFSIAGTDLAVAHMPEYFSFTSSNPAVASITGGKVHVLGTGTATITAKLGALDATGTITVNATAPPATAAPAPSAPASDVISLYSNAYANVPVDKWSADWDKADVAEITIAGNATRAYTNLEYAGIEFITHQIDATAMNYFHMDVWVPGGTTFNVKLVDFGADGVYGGCPNCGDDREQELSFNAGTTPALALGTWVGLDIPFTSFTNLTSRTNLAQFILSGDTRTVFVDNVYFHK